MRVGILLLLGSGVEGESLVPVTHISLNLELCTCCKFNYSLCWPHNTEGIFVFTLAE